MSDATTALEEKWAQEEASKAPLEKAYEKIGQKKTDEENSIQKNFPPIY